MRDVRANHARVDVLLHCAGLEISHTLDDKSQREFDLVFDVKCDGWFNLLHGLGDLELGAAVVFSSIAGRFGNGGQTDYSAANDLLCKSVSSFRTTRPGDAWHRHRLDGVGEHRMASRGSIPKMMAIAGIDMLPPEVGVPVVRREITAAGPGGEVVVAGSLGMLLGRDASGRAGPRRRPFGARRTAGPMLGERHRVDVGGRAGGAHHARPGRAGASSTITASTARQCCPGVMGIEALRRGGVRLGAGLDRRCDRGRRLPGAVQVLPRRAPHVSSCVARPRLAGDDAGGRLPPRSPAGRSSTSPSSSPPTSPDGCGWRTRPPRRPRAADPPRRAARLGRRRRGDLPHLLPRPRLPGPRRRVARRRAASSAGWRSTCLRTTSRTMLRSSSSPG